MSAPLTIPRGRRGTAATITALLATLVCAAAATEAISLAAHRHTVGFSAHSVIHYGETTRLSATAVLVVGIVVAALGVLLLAAAVVPPRRREWELTNDDPRLAESVTRSGLRRTLAAAAEQVDGVSGADVKYRRHRAVVVATTHLRDTSGLQDLLQTATTTWLQELDPARLKTVRVSLKHRET